MTRIGTQHQVSSAAWVRVLPWAVSGNFLQEDPGPGPGWHPAAWYQRSRL